MDKKWNFEPDPITRSYINYLDKSPIKIEEENIQLITKVIEEKLKNYHLDSNYKEQLTYIFGQLKDYDFSQELPFIDITGNKEKGIIYINSYPRTNFSKNCKYW